MATPTPDSLDRLSPSELIGVVRDLIGEVGRLRAENEKLGEALTKLKAEHQAVKDELARLKKLPPRPPQKPSGMDKATDGGGGEKSLADKKSSRRRGSQLDRLMIGATVGCITVSTYDGTVAPAAAIAPESQHAPTPR